MLVKATQRGFIHWVRQPGEIFEIKDHLFSKEWMVPVTDTTDGVPETPPSLPSVALSAGPQATEEPNFDAAEDPENFAPANPVPPT